MGLRTSCSRLILAYISQTTRCHVSEVGPLRNEDICLKLMVKYLPNRIRTELNICCGFVWVLTPCRLVGVYRNSEEPTASVRMLFRKVGIHGVMTQKVRTLTFTALGTLSVCTITGVSEL